MGGRPGGPRKRAERGRNRVAHTPRKQENGKEPKWGCRERKTACSHQCWLGPGGARAQGGVCKRLSLESQSGRRQPGVVESGEDRGHVAGGLLSLLRAGAFSGSSVGLPPQALSRTDGLCDVRPGWGSPGRGRKNQTSTTQLVCCWQGRVQIPWPGDTLGVCQQHLEGCHPPGGGCLPGGTHERGSLGPPWGWTEGHGMGSGALPRGQATARPTEGP